jgi:protein-L-isoaspartate(D-aspartate) O-methyltransferase
VADTSDPSFVTAARRAGVEDPRVLDALAAVSRERFVPADRRGEAHLDRPLPIGDGQTTSQPSLIAAMLAMLELTGTERILEVGTGFGYQTALLAHLTVEVHSIERFATLAARARANLEACGLVHVHVVVGDGTRGLPDHAPFDGIVVSAASAEVPAALGEQLAPGGRLVAPVGPPGRQEVWSYRRGPMGLERDRRLTAVRFVPLVAGDDPSTAS